MVRFAAVFVLSSLVSGSPLPGQDGGNGLRAQPDPQNIVASSLLGTWQLDGALNKRLGNKSQKDRLEFRDDAAVLGKVPAALAKKLGQYRIYLAGTMVLGDKEHAFLMTAITGNPTIVWFRERDGDPLGDAESWNVSLVRAEASQEDLLFVGGDSNNESFAAYSRATKAVGKLEPAAAIADMIGLLQAGKGREFVETYCAPADLGEMIKGGRSLDTIGARFEGERGKEMAEALLAASKKPPTMNDAGDVASWKVDIGPGTMSLQRIDGRWYLRNR